MTILIRMSNPDMDPKTVIPDAVVLAALNAEETVLRATAPWTTKEIPDTLSEWPNANVVAMRAALTAAADAINPEDSPLWEPLEGPLREGDMVWRELNGVTTLGVVGRVGGYGDPYTAEGTLIGRLDYGTWHFIRPEPKLPEKLSAVIVPNDGYKFIEAKVGALTFRANEAVFGGDDKWYGVWHRSDGQMSMGFVASTCIISPTWKTKEK